MSQSTTGDNVVVVIKSSEDPLLDPCAAAQYVGYKPNYWRTIVAKGKAPKPDEVNPHRWRLSTLDTWTQSKPSPEAARQQLVSNRPGNWKILHRELNVHTVEDWLARHLIVDCIDVVTLDVRIDRSPSKQMCSLTFVRDPRSVPPEKRRSISEVEAANPGFFSSVNGPFSDTTAYRYLTRGLLTPRDENGNGDFFMEWVAEYHKAPILFVKPNAIDRCRDEIRSAFRTASKEWTVRYSMEKESIFRRGEYWVRVSYILRALSLPVAVPSEAEIITMGEQRWIWWTRHGKAVKAELISDGYCMVPMAEDTFYYCQKVWNKAGHWPILNPEHNLPDILEVDGITYYRKLQVDDEMAPKFKALRSRIPDDAPDFECDVFSIEKAQRETGCKKLGSKKQREKRNLRTKNYWVRRQKFRHGKSITYIYPIVCVTRDSVRRLCEQLEKCVPPDRTIAVKRGAIDLSKASGKRLTIGACINWLGALCRKKLLDRVKTELPTAKGLVKGWVISQESYDAATDALRKVGWRTGAATVELRNSSITKGLTATRIAKHQQKIKEKYERIVEEQRLLKEANEASEHRIENSENPDDNGAAACEKKVEKRKKGRPKNSFKKKAADRDARLIEDWKQRKYGDQKTAYARPHCVDPSHARRIIGEYEHERVKKNVP